MKIKYINIIILSALIAFGFVKSVQANYNLEGTAFFAYKDKFVETNYSPEGIAFYAYSSELPDTKPVYRFANKTNGDHFYTISEAEKTYIENNLSSIYTPENIAFYAYSSELPDTKPVYRFVNKTNGDHFYTTSEAERAYVENNLSSIYTPENIAFYAYSSELSNTKPVYRFVNKTNGDHFYTISEAESKTIEKSSQKITNPIYRFINIKNGDHFYTINTEEKDFLLKNRGDYRYEGVAFYSYKLQNQDALPVFRFVNTISGDHFYTIDEIEKNTILANDQWNYNFEGIAFYAHKSKIVDTFPIYRLNDGNDHFYTINEIEKNYITSSMLGPNISVGLWHYDKSGIQDDPFEIEANKPYNIKDINNNIIAQIGGNTETKVTYDSNGNLKVYDSISSTLLNKLVKFDAADGDNSNIIFNVHRPNSSYDEYRGTVTVRYYRGKNIIANTGDTVTQIWIINTLPLEQYTWGMGETTGTGDIEHTKVMTTIFRTYGRWYIEYATKYAPLGFKIRSDSGSQIYKGHEWEKDHSNIKKAAEETRGVIATYNNEIALTPYSSWSDGRTRSFKERWGSDNYPWCKSVSDPYGKHPSHSTTELEHSGNHMVGLIAHGSLNLASEHDWSYNRIMKYYYTGISLKPLY